MTVPLPCGETPIAADRPDDTVILSIVDACRHRFTVHPIHGVLATHRVKRLRQVGRVIVTVPLHAYGLGDRIAYVAHPPLTR